MPKSTSESNKQMKTLFPPKEHESPGQVVEVLQALVLLQGGGQIDDPIGDWEHEVVGLSANRAAQPKLDAEWLAELIGPSDQPGDKQTGHLVEVALVELRCRPGEALAN